MGIFSDLFKGAILLSFIALGQHAFSVKKMASHAVDAHKRGLTSYGTYSRQLTGYKKSWADTKKAPIKEP